MNDICPENRFLGDVAHHAMEVIRDEGLHRHIRFKKPGTYCMHFDLITWPGYLCYTGDMGTYVFRRLEDMFEFFRTDRENMRLRDGHTLAINPEYWGEKLEAVDRGDGFKKYSADKFKRIVNELVGDHIEERGWPIAGVLAMELRDAVHEQVLCRCENEFEAHDAAGGFQLNEFVFSDFWEHDLTDYTYRFIWCCYALAWGIQKYDASKGGAAC